MVCVLCPGKQMKSVNLRMFFPEARQGSRPVISHNFTILRDYLELKA